MTQRSLTPAIAYVGTVVPDTPAYHNAAFSRAGNMYQDGLTGGLAASGGSPLLILSQRPTPVFPRSRKLWWGRGHDRLQNNLLVEFLPFPNIMLVRQLFVGLYLVLRLLVWAWENRERQRVVCLYNLTEPSGLFTWLAARLVGARMIPLVCDVNIPGVTVPATVARRIDFWLQKQMIPRMDALVVVNRQIADDFAPATPAMVVEGGVNPRLFDTPDPVATQRPFTIAAAGTLYDVNGFGEILEAFRLLREKPYRLLIAGGGPLEAQVRQAAAEDPRIDFRGYLSFQEVLALYQEADVLVSMRPTKRLDTKYFSPSKLMEYMASGVPVITTCVGDVEEVFGEHLYLLREETAQGLAQIIEHVASCDPQERAARGRAARRFMAAHRTWGAQGKRIAEFISAQVARP